MWLCFNPLLEIMKRHTFEKKIIKSNKKKNAILLLPLLWRMNWKLEGVFQFHTELHTDFIDVSLCVISFFLDFTFISTKALNSVQLACREQQQMRSDLSTCVRRSHSCCCHFFYYRVHRPPVQCSALCCQNIPTTWRHVHSENVFLWKEKYINKEMSSS